MKPPPALKPQHRKSAEAKQFVEGVTADGNSYEWSISEAGLFFRVTCRTCGCWFQYEWKSPPPGRLPEYSLPLTIEEATALWRATPPSFSCPHCRSKQPQTGPRNKKTASSAHLLPTWRF